MKVTLFLLAFFGLTSASIFMTERQKAHNHHVRSRNLNDLLEQFVAFIPFDKCKAIVDDYLANNADVQAAYAFLLSDEFKSLTDKVVAMPEYQNFLKYLSNAGLDIYTYQNIFRKILGLPTVEPPTVGAPKLHLTAVRESGIIRMITDILNVLPIADIKKWFYNTCLPDPDFQDLLVKLGSQEFRDLVDIVHHTKEYQELTDVLRSQGIDVDAIEKAISDFISGNFVRRVNPRTLKSLLHQFFGFIPTDDVLNIILTYVKTSEDIQKAFAFLQGDEFRNLVIKMEGSGELQDFLAWVYTHEIDVYSYINSILELSRIPPINSIKVPQFRSLSVQSDLTDMIDDIMAILPIADIVAWYHSTCEINPEFQDLLAQLRSDSFQVVVDTVRKDPAFPIMHQLLIDLGIDTVAVEKWLHDFFDW